MSPSTRLKLSTKTVPRQFFPAEGAKLCLRTRFEQAELGIGELHFTADLILCLLKQIEARENFTVPVGNASQDTFGNLFHFTPNCCVFGARAVISHGKTKFQVNPVAPVLHRAVDMPEAFPRPSLSLC